MSRKVSTCRSGITSRCVSAPAGVMSRIATKPSALRTWSPSRYSRQKRQSSGSEDPLLRRGSARGRARARRRARRRATASSRRRSRGRAGRRGRCRPRRASRASARGTRPARGSRRRALALLLHLRRDRTSSAAVAVPGPRRVREDVHLRDAAPRGRRAGCSENASLVLAGEADDHIGREVEVGEALEPAQIRRRPCSAAPSPGARRRRPTGAARADGARPFGVSRSARSSARRRG